MVAIYYAGADLPDLAVAWRDRSNVLIDFSVGHTFSVKVGPDGGPAAITKTSGITGAATDPNLVIAWAITELGTLAPGTYVVQITAIRTADSKERKMLATIEIRPGL